MTDPTTRPEVPDDSATLHSGAAMPLLGFGTWQLKGQTASQPTAWALESGYRHLDTATVYENEREVGQALADAPVARGDVFVTTKFPPERPGEEDKTLRASLDALGLTHLDLWLIHAPSGDNLSIWKAFVAAREQGHVRDIGVSNFTLEQIDEVTAATGVTPAVNQIKWSPLLFDRAVLAGHQERGVVLEGYSGLRDGTLDHPVITGIAVRLGRTPAQVIVRWHLQHETVVIPKSSQPARIASNADVDGFTLTADDMSALDDLGSDPIG